ncbi:hypothetical protein NUSPORA_02292 [Nucleospora cyclopteri]
MHKFSLKNTSTISLETLTIPNKNINSYFDKKDETFVISPNYKFPSYSFEVATILLTNDFLVIKFKDEEKIVKILEYENFCQYEAFLARTIRDNLIERQNTSNEEGEIKKIKHTKNKPNHDLFIQLIFDSFMGRDDLIAHVDLFLNTLQLKGIQLLPTSICIALHLKQPNVCLNFMKEEESEGFAFVEDFTMIDSYLLGNKKRISDNFVKHDKYNKVIADNEDFAEEFSRLKTMNPDCNFSCRKCDTKEESEKAISKHITKDHKHLFGKTKDISDDLIKQYYYEYKNMNDFSSRIEFIFTSKMKKVENSTYYVELIDKGEDKQEKKQLEISFASLIKAAEDFRNLETSKEMWLTDKEWERARLRLLKEKILFYI